VPCSNGKKLVKVRTERLRECVDVEKLEAVELVMVRPVWLIRDITTTIGIASTTAKITAEND
jgi:hypothetical protein